MKKNGHRRWTLDFSQELAFERHARALSLPTRTGLLGWLPVPARLCRPALPPPPGPHLLGTRPRHRRVAPAMRMSSEKRSPILRSGR